MHREPAVCSWSLQPQSPSELTDRVRECGLSAVQLALDPLRVGAWDETETVRLLEESNITIISGMMSTAGEDYSTLASIRETGGLRPDRTWQQNLIAAQACADIASRFGLNLVTLHAGFIPHNREVPEYHTMIDRIRSVAEIFAAQDIRLGLETGQETASALQIALGDIAHPGVGVNFDPANMLLYGMGDPVESLAVLAPHIMQIHIKDAIASEKPDDWGEEVPVGHGEVNWPAFFSTVLAKTPEVNLVIEREAGQHRAQDIRTAASIINRHMDPLND